MKNAGAHYFFVFLSFFTIVTQAEFERPGATGGGAVVPEWTSFGGNQYAFRFYSLDLVEYGIEKTAQLEAPNSLENPFMGQQLLPDYKVEKSSSGYWYLDSIKKPLFKLFSSMELFQIYEGEVKIVGFLNKLYQVRKVCPKYADLLINTFFDLEWMFVNAPLEKTNDTNSVISSKVIYQIARNDDGDVRIAKNGYYWSVVGEEGNVIGRIIEPPNSANQVAVITHELIYWNTIKQGDKDSVRARKANAFLFQNRDMDSYIKKSCDLILK